MDQRVHIVFLKHFSDISFFFATRLYCYAFVSLSTCKKMHAMPPLNTTQSGKLPDTTPPHLMQCFVATVRRRHPPKRFRNHVRHCLVGKISIMALQPLPSRFRCCRRFLVWTLAPKPAWRAWSSPLAELGRSSLSNSPDFWPTAVSPGRTGPRVPCRCACGLTRPRFAHLAFGCAGRSNARHVIGTQRSDHVHGTTHCFTTSSHGTRNH